MPRSKMTSGGGRDRAKALIVNQILNETMPYVPGWVQTLGRAGAPNSKAPYTTKVKAAQTGLEFMSRMMNENEAAGGGAEALLKSLQDMEAEAGGFESDSGEGADWSEDALIPTETSDLG